MGDSIQFTDKTMALFACSSKISPRCASREFCDIVALKVFLDKTSLRDDPQKCTTKSEGGLTVPL